MTWTIPPATYNTVLVAFLDGSGKAVWAGKQLLREMSISNEDEEYYLNLRLLLQEGEMLQAPAPTPALPATTPMTRRKPVIKKRLSDPSTVIPDETVVALYDIYGNKLPALDRKGVVTGYAGTHFASMMNDIGDIEQLEVDAIDVLTDGGKSLTFVRLPGTSWTCEHYAPKHRLGLKRF